MGARIWLLIGAESELRRGAQVGRGDLVIKDRGDRLAVGHVDGDATVLWSAEVDADLLPDQDGRAKERPPSGPIRRVQHAPRLERALERLDRADRVPGV